MTTLYNCKHDGDQFHITKFDADMNPEASYLLSETECECPAGHRPTCRHRQMLPRFLQREAVGNGLFYNYDHGTWIVLPVRDALISGHVHVHANAEPEPPLSLKARFLKGI